MWIFESGTIRLLERYFINHTAVEFEFEKGLQVAFVKNQLDFIVWFVKACITDNPLFKTVKRRQTQHLPLLYICY